MQNREFLQLAKNYDDFIGKIGIGSWFVSEKIDGMRCWWDGGISRGMYCDTVAWANTEKDDRLKERAVATGLWSRYGKPVHAPDWWVDRLPPFPLDGELYLGRGSFQELISIVKTHVPDSESWKGVKFHVLDSPHWNVVLQHGRLNNPNFRKVFNFDVNTIIGSKIHPILPFEQMQIWLSVNLPKNETVILHPQTQLGYRNSEAEAFVQDQLMEVTAGGGEGLILRHPTAYWTPSRCNIILKVKKLYDETAIVKGYVWGRMTDKGSKLAGLMGALIVSWKGHTFELSGFTDEERILYLILGDRADSLWMPGQIVDLNMIYSKQFKIGSEVRFVYRELSDTGIPKEARYLRY